MAMSLPPGATIPITAGMESPGDPFSLAQGFQHPFVPQDLWQMPMTLEWDWADMTRETGGLL